MPGELAEDPIDVENNNHTDQNTSTSLWKVSTLPNIGKVLLVTRDIKPWEKVLEDTALVTAPCNSAACLGCLGAYLERWCVRAVSGQCVRSSVRTNNLIKRSVSYFKEVKYFQKLISWRAPMEFTLLFLC